MISECPYLVREMGVEPTRPKSDTGTSSLPVYQFQHSRMFLLWREDNYSRYLHLVNKKI